MRNAIAAVVAVLTVSLPALAGNAPAPAPAFTLASRSG